MGFNFDFLLAGSPMHEANFRIIFRGSLCFQDLRLSYLRTNLRERKIRTLNLTISRANVYLQNKKEQKYVSPSV
jgi:hypothetical protein